MTLLFNETLKNTVVRKMTELNIIIFVVTEITFHFNKVVKLTANNFSLLASFSCLKILFPLFYQTINYRYSQFCMTDTETNSSIAVAVTCKGNVL